VPISLPKTGLPNKHSWAVLDANDCFNFFNGQTLNPHPPTCSVLTDLTGQFNDVTMTGGSNGAFRRFDLGATANISSVNLINTLNADNFTVALGALGFAPNTDITLTQSTLDALPDVIQLVNATTPKPPSKVQVNAIDAYNWTFDLTTGTTTIPGVLGTHVTSVLYNTFDMALGLTGVPAIGNQVTFDLTGGLDGEAYGLLYSAAGTNYIPLSFIGDGDPRWLLLDLFTFDSLGGGTLSNGGQDHFPATIPNAPFLVGSIFYLQAVTAPGATAGIPFIIGRISNQYVLTVQ
jgi:hypothetical protein